ncbi:MAG TPA: hypothetical protein VN539_05210 [Candidatus Saccharimonadales bacterium]|nr:hypothetical protein [Candidatus Saccharimonadales bacterium]
MTPDASALYNAGTAALRRGDLGPAIAHLRAAQRLDPRAHDVATNLAIARSRVEERQGSGRPITVMSSPELWNAAGAITVLGALLLLASVFRPRPRRLLVLGGATLALGTLLGLGLMLRAREEARHPEAVVVAPMLDVLPAPDERPVSPYLLAAGEEVRLGSARGDLVEVRVGGNTIGWARRSGLWRVDEAPRYTARSGSK